MVIKSLKARQHDLSYQEKQLEWLSNGVFASGSLPRFDDRLRAAGISPLSATRVGILQVNVGYICNQVCKHCHVDAGPDRREIMTRETMQQCLDAIEKNQITTLDITGGAPEMNPDFRWFVAAARAAGVKEIIVRSNLTIIVSNERFRDLPVFFREHGVRVCSSLPYYQPDKTDRQRGDGVFAKSIEALTLLNAQGYGVDGSGLILDLVYNPTGAFLPGDQAALERDFKRQLLNGYKVLFNNLFTITNIPISRFLDFLIASGNYEEYMEKLVMSFNPAAVQGVMCRNTVSVDWQGNLYDCDFNQMLGLRSKAGSGHIADFTSADFDNRPIVTNQHCYACTAGAGSSCQGSLVK